jgi:hypothetical protein
MIVRFLSVVLTVCCAFEVSGAQALYVNSSPLLFTDTPPQINAVTFVNQSIFEVVDRNAQPMPYQTMNTLNFRNELTGRMAGNPGFRFDYFTGNTRNSMDSWINYGSITTDNAFFGITNFLFTFFSPANWLMVWSDDIENHGTLQASPQGLIRLEGTTLDLSRGRIRTGGPTNAFQFFGGSWLLSSNYFNDPGITDLWWGAGSNNVIRGQGSLMQLDSFFNPSFTLPFIESAVHEVVEPFSFLGGGGGGFFTNIVSIPFFRFGGYTAVAYTNQVGADKIVQVVFLPTNSFDTNMNVDVRFSPEFDGGATVVVGFHTRDYDVALDRQFTNSVYLLDALAFQTNVSLARNLQQGVSTRRPNTYEVTRDTPFQLFNSGPGNAAYTNGMLYNPGYASNAVPVTYAGYRAFVNTVSFTDPQITGSGLSDPTNYPGRIEIIGQNVNFKDARIRADSSLVITAPNITGNDLPRVSAPFLNAEIGTTHPQLTVSNFVPATVGRVAGEIMAWSATWNNTEVATTNNVRFHVLVIDHTFSSRQAVIMNDFSLTGNDVLLHDFATVRRSIKLNATSLDIKESGGLIFPQGANWASSNVTKMFNFTNSGYVNVSGATRIGVDKGKPYLNYVNRGTNISQVHFIWTEHFENSGSIESVGGAFTLDSIRAQIRGTPPTISSFGFTNYSFNPFTGLIVTNIGTNVFTNATTKITTFGDLVIRANSITLSNALLQAGTGVPGRLVLAATNRLTDMGVHATNYLLASAGIQVLAKPKNFGDLLGTYARSSLGESAEATHIWPAVDLGPNAVGFSNNLALGKLTLDGGAGSVFRFAGSPGKKTALYIDYLELLNNATNFTTALVLDPSVKIYFANANVPVGKLDNSLNGNLRWVRSFAGPLSSTNFVYPSGQTYSFNIALVQDKDIDSDGDGIVNSRDSTPIFVGENLDVRIVRGGLPGRVRVSWQSLAGITSYVDFKNSVNSWEPWQTLMPTNTTFTGRVQMTDFTSNSVQRVYRVRMDTPSP